MRTVATVALCLAAGALYGCGAPKPSETPLSASRKTEPPRKRPSSSRADETPSHEPPPVKEPEAEQDDDDGDDDARTALPSSSRSGH